MPRNVKDLKSAWVDPDDAPELTGEVFARAALKEGEAVLRPATGTLTRRGRPGWSIQSARSPFGWIAI